MVIAPKTKFLIALGTFVLVVFGLMSLSGQTFSGSVVDLVIPKAGDPKMCADLQTDCTKKGGKGVSFDNYGKLCTSILTIPDLNTEKKTDATPQSTPRRRAPSTQTTPTRSAAPEVPTPAADTTPPTGAADLQKLQELFPEAKSQGQIDSSTLR